MYAPGLCTGTAKTALPHPRHPPFPLPFSCPKLVQVQTEVPRHLSRATRIPEVPGFEERPCPLIHFHHGRDEAAAQEHAVKPVLKATPRVPGSGNV